MPKKAEEKAQDQNTLNEIIHAIDDAEVDPDRHLSIQVDKSIREGIQAAQRSGEKASITLTVAIEPGPDRRVQFSAKVTAKLPRPPVAAVTLYADGEGTLHNSDPKQMRMELTNALNHDDDQEN